MEIFVARGSGGGSRRQAVERLAGHGAGDQLKKLNNIEFKGETHRFSETNIHSAILALKDVVYDGLVRTNEKIYDLLVLGKSLPQTIAGDTKSFRLTYIDWNPETWLKNNVFFA